MVRHAQAALIHRHPGTRRPTRRCGTARSNRGLMASWHQHWVPQRPSTACATQLSAWSVGRQEPESRQIGPSRIMEEDLVSTAASLVPSDVPAVARTIVECFVDEVLGTLGPSVEGVVLFGSLVAGGFSAETSDIDLIVAVAADIDDEGLLSLPSMHERLASAHPAWTNRLDVVYIPASALRSDRGGGSPMVVISPGEPVHRTTTDPGWIMNWHAARGFGCSLRAYATLAACRALYTCNTGKQASKEDAALWAERQYPEWSAAVREARIQREGGIEGTLAGHYRFSRSPVCPFRLERDIAEVGDTCDRIVSSDSPAAQQGAAADRAKASSNRPS